MKYFLIFLTLLFITNLVSGSRILFIFPNPSKSHMIFIHSFSTALAEKGHNVTVISPFPMKKSPRNHHDVYLKLSDHTQNAMATLMNTPSKNLYKMIKVFSKININMTNDVLTSKIVHEVLKEKFDLLVIGFVTNGLLGIAEQLNCPVIVVSNQRHTYFLNKVVGNSVSVNAVPHALIDKLKMNFFDRVKNFLLAAFDIIAIEYMNYNDKLIYEKYFPSPKYRSFEDALKNISLYLVNDHFSEGVVRPLVPGLIEIRGINIKSTPELPNDIQKFLDGAEHGAIYFSLGTNIKSEFVSNDTFKIILSVFSKLPQKVIMKWDNENMSPISGNIMIKEWLPQEDILMHPNMKLFISHCGLGSIDEAKYHGVPILGLPFFFDQISNADREFQQGWILQMDPKKLKEVEFRGKIKEMLENEKYAIKVKELSRLLRDRPLSPKDTAVYWTEYVINHRGAKHLQYLAIHQNFWQRNSLDVIGFLILCLYMIGKLLKISFIFLKPKATKVTLKNNDKMKKEN